MKIQKLIRQYGEHGNDYSLIEVGDTVNEIIDLLVKNNQLEIDTKIIEKDPIVVVEKVESLEQAKQNYTPLQGDMAVRSPSSQDRVYLIRDSKKHWIRNPETLFKLGFTFHNVKNISNEEMDTYETGEDLNLKDEKKLEVVKPKEDGFDKYNI